MDRDPVTYSRPLVIAGLLPLLLAESYVGLPTSVFVGGSLLVVIAAAGIHLYGDEPRAGAGWLALGSALAVVTLVDLATNRLALVGVLVLVALGVLLFASQRFAGDE